MLYSRTELKHLKYKLIEKDGLTEQEADKRISDLIEYTSKAQEKKRNGGKKRKIS